MSPMRRVLEDRIRRWLNDPESTVEYAEEVDGRWAVRVRQETRETTTVWFDVGERSLSFEAYVLPAPAEGGPLHKHALRRNAQAWRVFFAVDSEGGLVLRGRLAEDQVTIEELDKVLGEIYEAVEVSFRPLLEIAKYTLRNL